MTNRVERAILGALRRNTFTADQAIQVHAHGRTVILTGEVDREDLIYEAVATAESVSPLLAVHSRLQVRDQALQSTHV